MAPSNALSAEVYDTAIARAAGDAGISGAEADRVFQRLEQYKLDTVAGLAHFEFGLLRSESTRPAGLAKLKTLVTGPGASAAPSDSPELNTMLSSLADGIATAWLQHMAAANKGHGSAGGNGGTDKDEDSSDRSAALSAYSDLDKWQGRVISLEDKMAAPSLGRMRKEAQSQQHIETVPSVRNVPMASKTGMKREVNIGQLSDGGTVRFSVAGEGTVANANTFSKVQHNVRALINGIVAVYSRPISPSAYGGGKAGYVRVPMENRQVRVQMCVASGDRLIWKLVESATQYGADVEAYIQACDRVIFEFLKLGETLTMHPSDVVNHLIEVRPNLFTYSYESGAALKARRAAPGPANGGAGTTENPAPKNTDGRAICKSWLENGSCRLYNEGKCEANHPAGRQGALMGGGRRSSGGGGYAPYPAHNWNSAAPSWGPPAGNAWSPPQWNRQAGKGKGGGGKGKNGKGKGGKAGQSRNQWW